MVQKSLILGREREREGEEHDARKFGEQIEKSGKLEEQESFTIWAPFHIIFMHG